VHRFRSLLVSSEPVKAACGALSVNGHRRQNPNWWPCRMEEEQELVYGWLGLTPPCLLRSPTQCEQT